MSIDIKSLAFLELTKWIEEQGQPKFRAKQIFEWLHKKRAVTFEAMTNLPKELIASLMQQSHIKDVKMIKRIRSKSDSTTKYLFDIGNGVIIETVVMHYEYGNTICVSSQAGCKMGCLFCASAKAGFERNLTASEMLSQVYNAENDLSQNDSGKKISNVVIMGSGEPLDNYDNTIAFIDICNDKNGLNIGARHITISTCGLVDKIYDLANLKLQCTLAISLHAPNDNIRRKLMPVAKNNAMEELLTACKFYAETTKRRITYEYALIKDVNDSVASASQLSKKLKGTLCHVNLIPINEIKEQNFVKTSDEDVVKFAQVLKDYGIETTIRRKLGSSINAACGQLRLDYTTL